MRRFRLLLFLLLAMKLGAQENTTWNAGIPPTAVHSGERFLSFADGADASPATNSINFSSPEVHADRSVTFRLYAPKAKRVALESDCLYPKPDLSAFGEKTRKQRMKRDSAGVWSFTTQPLQPELYFYNFIVDGKRMHDPANPDSTYVLLHQVSLFAVGGSAYSDLYQHAPAEQRGRIDSLSYYSEQQKINRRVLVYVPQGYADNLPCRSAFGSNASCDAGATLPVLYLLHGISGDERGWIEHGRAADILDNLIAQKRIPPMLVVMPDCNVVRRIRKGKRTNLLRNMLNYPTLCAGGFEDAFHELEDFIASRYPISTAPTQHAIAGLSSGARQAANIVNLQPDTFGTVGIFSPVVHHGQLPLQKDSLSSPSIAPTSSSPSVAPEFNSGNSPRYLLYLGTNDLFYKNGKRFSHRLQKRGINCQVFEYEGGHTWRNWRHFLVDFLPQLTSFSNKQ